MNIFIVALGADLWANLQKAVIKQSKNHVQLRKSHSLNDLQKSYGEHFFNKFRNQLVDQEGKHFYSVSLSQNCEKKTYIEQHHHHHYHHQVFSKTE